MSYETASGLDSAVLRAPASDANRSRMVDDVLRRFLDTPGSRLLCRRNNDSVLPRILQKADLLRYGQFAVGVEVLPFHIVAILADPTGAPIQKARRDFNKMDGPTVAREIGIAARELTSAELGIDLPSKRVAVGVQIGGPVDTRRGVVLSYANNPTAAPFAVDPVKWNEPVPLAAMVKEETGCPTVIENDAAAYAVLEQRFGVGVETGSFAVILIRDGVGGGIVLDHRLASFPFEIGHLRVPDNARECECGIVGCVESVSGRRALRAIVGEIMEMSVEDIKRAIALGRDDHEKVQDVLNAFFSGGVGIGCCIASILTIFGVSHVVIYCDDAMAPTDAIHDVEPAITNFFAGVDTFRNSAFPAFKECRLEVRRWRSTDGAHGAALVALSRLFCVPLSSPERT